MRAADIDDLRQAVVEGLLRSVEDPPTSERREALAIVIARRRFVDALRKRGRRHEASEDVFDLVDQDEGFDPSPRVSDASEALSLRDELRALVRDGTLSERDVGMLAAKAEGFSDEEVGFQFGCTKRTVANVCCMARHALRPSRPSQRSRP